MAGDTTTREGRQGGSGRQRRRCFGGSNTCRSRYENGDEWTSLNDPPSVRMMQPEWNLSMDDEGTKSKPAWNTSHEMILLRISHCADNMSS